MPVLISVQLRGFFIFIVSGFILGIIYDVFSAFRLNFPNTKIAVPVLDAFFWIIFTLMFFVTLQSFCGGAFRPFFLAGAISGFILYLFTVSKFLMPLFQKSIHFLICALKCILHKIFGTFYAFLRFFFPIYAFLRRFVQFTLKRIINFVKKNVEIARRFGVLLKKV